jgi:uncharacterized protein YgiM (DUF1202 family)
MKLTKTHPVLALILSTALLVNIAPSTAQSGPGNYGNVSTVYACSRDGDTINIRARAGQQHRVLFKVKPGRSIVLVGTTRVVGEFTWQKVNYNGVIGWIRGDFLCN